MYTCLCAHAFACMSIFLRMPGILNPSPSPSPSLRRSLFCLYIKLYGAIACGLFVVYLYDSFPHAAALAMYSFWIPQVLGSFMKFCCGVWVLNDLCCCSCADTARGAAQSPQGSAARSESTQRVTRHVSPPTPSPTPSPHAPPTPFPTPTPTPCPCSRLRGLQHLLSLGPPPLPVRQP